jgi:zinc transport system substrate-binding protein
MKLFRTVLPIMLLCIIVANNLAMADKLPVFASILPLKYFVEHIGGERVAVSVMVQPGASPATYEPKPMQMAALSQTRLYFAIGVPFERSWLDKIAAANTAMQVVHTDQGITKIPMARHHHEQEQSTSGHGHDHDEHGILDPHIWLAPALAEQISQHIVSALTRVDPAGRDVYEGNFKKLCSDIQKLDADLANLFSDAAERRFIVFHPAWGYLAKAYGLQQVPIEVEGKDPKPAQLMALITFAREQGITAIFAQPQFSAKSARQVAREIHGQVIFVDPLAYNWADNLRDIAVKLRSALR